MIQVKDHSIRLGSLAPQIVLALLVAQEAYRKHGEDVIITSVNDGAHSQTSLHYVGHAVDLRTKHLKPIARQTVRDDIAVALGADFDVILESDHLHIEYQPKRWGG